MRKLFFGLTAAVAAMVSPLALADEVVLNGGFETQGAGGPATAQGWNTGGGGAPGTIFVRDGLMPRTGGFAMHLVAQGADGIGANAAVTQNSIQAMVVRRPECFSARTGAASKMVWKSRRANQLCDAPTSVCPMA